ncbi:glycosyltransferase [Mailhella massiliensis]|uniref:glycosyltransferase n=1 Tax=Mailhella massiliensis TaxID=1903261 RepID=UPI00097D3FCB|nr:glycosyltransferase [Mailhella massiliensis]
MSLFDDKVIKEINNILIDYKKHDEKKCIENEKISNENIRLKDKINELNNINKKLYMQKEYEKKEVENKVKGHLSYQIGYEIVHKMHKWYGIFVLPFTLYNIYKNFENKKIHKQRNIDISVIIAVYNCKDFIRQCLDSLIKQTVSNFEIICVDDGSTDNTLNILREYEKKYDFISVYTQKNQYAGVARNTGMSYAKGNYLLFLDSDDFFEPQMLEVIYNRAKETNADIVVFNAQEYNMKDNIFQPCKFPVSPELFPDKNVSSYIDFGEKLFQANSCLAWNKLIKYSFIKKVGVKFGNTKSSNDTVFIYSLLAQAEKISLVNEILVNYRTNNPNSLQRSKSSSWESICLAFFNLKKELIKLGVYESQKRTYVNKSLQACMYYINTIDDKTKIKMKCSLKNKYFKLLDIDDYGKNYIYNKNFYNQYMEIMSNEYIPVVYATDNNYAKYMAVSIQSIIKNVGNKTTVLFFVMVNSDFEKSNISKLENIVYSSGHYIEFINMENQFKGVKTTINHITYQTFYRLAIPNVLSYLNKIIYIDCDTVINCDIRDLYKINIKDNYIAGVKAYAFDNKKHRNRLNIDTKNYVNAGVLIINNRLLIKDKLINKFYDLINKNYDCQDQDILNVSCVGKIMNIPFKYNIMTKYYFQLDNFISENKVTKEEIDDALNSLSIIHYADKVKPWNDKNSIYANYFWKYAKNSIFFQ